MTCRKTQTDRQRIDELRQAVRSPRRERWQARRCVHCGRLWSVNQFHRSRLFSCGDAVSFSDYEQACR
jgi:hypothetical protein